MQLNISFIFFFNFFFQFGSYIFSFYSRWIVPRMKNHDNNLWSLHGISLRCRITSKFRFNSQTIQALNLIKRHKLITAYSFIPWLPLGLYTRVYIMCVTLICAHQSDFRLFVRSFFYILICWTFALKCVCACIMICFILLTSLLFI